MLELFIGFVIKKLHRVESLPEKLVVAHLTKNPYFLGQGPTNFPLLLTAVFVERYGKQLIMPWTVSY
jgi:hypothetical protein